MVKVQPMRFIANLSNETIEAFAAHETQLAAYLLSSHRVTPSTLASARRVREFGLLLLADNGTKPLIDEVIGRFADTARQISIEARDVQHQVGRSPRGQDIPDTLRHEASQLANAVVDHCVELSEAIDTDKLIELQMSMSPTDIIAQEDFATACLIGLNLERELTGWRVSRFETRNRRSLRLWQRVVEDPRCANVRVYAVLSAIDFNTAVAAGRLAAQAGVTHGALGFAGINLDQRSTDFYVIGSASFSLERPAPRRYVRVSQIITGIAEGFRQAGGNLAKFHCLGLGAPLMFPVVAAGFNPETTITMDATSPIHDAIRHHVLYDPANDGSRASILSIVSRILGGGDWSFVSPFRISARERFGHNPKAARAWAAENGLDRILREHLSTPSDLTRALPLFTNADQEIFRLVSRVWIAHNHWVLDDLANQLSAPDRRSVALARIDRLINNSTSLPAVRGLNAAQEIIRRTNH
jgi:hypothetical protein